MSIQPKLSLFRWKFQSKIRILLLYRNFFFLVHHWFCGVFFRLNFLCLHKIWFVHLNKSTKQPITKQKRLKKLGIKYHIIIYIQVFFFYIPIIITKCFFFSDVYPSWQQSQRVKEWKTHVYELRQQQQQKAVHIFKHYDL